MKNLISLGGPQNGVHRFPRSEKLGFMFAPIQAAINGLAYTEKMQNWCAPLTYWHDTDEHKYRRGSTFLAVINNENEYNSNYVINLKNLKRLVLVKYEFDGAIVPKESSWFGYYDESGREHQMSDTAIYKNDRLGLQALRDSGKLVFHLSPGDHLHANPNWFAQNIVPYFKEIN